MTPRLTPSPRPSPLPTVKTSLPGTMSASGLSCGAPAGSLGSPPANAHSAMSSSKSTIIASTRYLPLSNFSSKLTKIMSNGARGVLLRSLITCALVKMIPPSSTHPLPCDTGIPSEKQVNSTQNGRTLLTTCSNEPTACFSGTTPSSASV